MDEVEFLPKGLDLAGNLRRTDDEPLEYFNYQLELAERALQGHNIIICARAGCGKTIVAIKVIQEHLDKRPKHKNAKVAFIVPAVPLINQQKKKCKQHLSGKYVINSIAGGSANDGKANAEERRKVVDLSHVLFMTPKILLLLLQDNTRLTDFSLLVLDECHHADEKHPYQELMIQYVDLKRTIDCRNLPQVLGLTASLGVKKSDTTEKAQEHLIKMAANLDAHYVATVKKYIEEFNEYNPKCIDEMIPVDLYFGTSARTFLEMVEGCMMKIETDLEPFLFEMRMKEGVSAFWKDMPAIPKEFRGHNKYLSWLCALIKEVKSLTDPGRKTEVMSWLRHLEAYENSLELNEHLPTGFAMKTLISELQLLADRQIKTNSVFCIGIYEGIRSKLNQLACSSEGNGLFDKLCAILQQEYSKKEPGLAIIIARTRNIVQNLAKLLNERHFGFIANFVTSTNSSGADGGMTVKQQEQVLQDFWEGKFQVLVGTKVIAEGLDIPKCTLVFKYNDVGNEIDLIQIDGRARHRRSRSILIARREYILDKEKLNMEREQLMEKALKLIDGMTDFSAKVDARQNEDFESRMADKQNNHTKLKTLENNQYSMICADCDEYFSESNKIRKWKSAYVSIDLMLWERLELKFGGGGKESFDKVALASKFCCPNCKREVGNVVKSEKTFFPVLTADRFVLRDRADIKLAARKQWSQIEKLYFKPPALEREEIKNNLIALTRNEPNSFKKLKLMMYE